MKINWKSKNTWIVGGMLLLLLVGEIGHEFLVQHSPIAESRREPERIRQEIQKVCSALPPYSSINVLLIGIDKGCVGDYRTSEGLERYRAELQDIYLGKDVDRLITDFSSLDLVFQRHKTVPKQVDDSHMGYHDRPCNENFRGLTGVYKDKIEFDVYWCSDQNKKITWVGGYFTVGIFY